VTTNSPRGEKDHRNSAKRDRAKRDRRNNATPASDDQGLITRTTRVCLSTLSPPVPAKPITARPGLLLERAERIRRCDLLRGSFLRRLPPTHCTGFALVQLLVTMHWFLLLLLVSLMAPFLRFGSCPRLRLPHAIPIEHLNLIGITLPLSLPIGLLSPAVRSIINTG
jgi:hypothetical protein